MEDLVLIDSNFIETHTSFTDLIEVIREAFANNDTVVPQRHHHNITNKNDKLHSTLLLMPAWRTQLDAGVKVVSVNPKNNSHGIPAIQGTYIYMSADTGEVKAILDGKSLTTKRTAATSALASKYLSRADSKSLLMIGTGALSPELIKAHSTIRPIAQVYVWGRNFENAVTISESLSHEKFNITPVKTIEEKIGDVDIISCATLSPNPLVLGRHLSSGQHLDLVGSYQPHTREADDEAITKSSVFLDNFESGLHESGDIAIPLQNGVLKTPDIKGDLFQLCKGQELYREKDSEITLFKSVGHALQDLAAARYYFNLFDT